MAVDAGEASLQHDAVGRKLADNLGTARKARKSQQQAGGDRENKLMQEVRDLGRYPKESKSNEAERRLYGMLRDAWRANKFSPEQEAEQEVLQQATSNDRAAAVPR